jgi:hypothetical protein
MGDKLSPDQLAFYQCVDELLWSDWDPIGINQNPEARNEYYGYLPEIFKLAMQGASESEISKQLLNFERSSMGLSGNDINCSRVARLVLNARQKLLQK